MKAAESSATLDHPTPAMPRDLRRKLNDSLRPGFAVAVNHPPTRTGTAAGQEVVSIKLPRSSSGRPPRGGVHIPQPAFAQARLGRVSKHAYQKAKNGCFGSKKARLTIAAKLMLMWLASCEAIRMAVERRRKRVQALVQGAVSVQAQQFSEAIQKGWGRVFGAKGV